MPKILVTGGTGYIGSHTVVELQDKGYEVVIVDDLSNSTADVIDHIMAISGKKPDFEVFDLADRDKTRDFFQRHDDLMGIIHFAAYKAVNESVEKPLLYYRNNLVSLMNILEGMQDHKIRCMVFSSSCAVYGQPDFLPVKEDAAIKKAWSPYGNTKQISEEIIADSCNVSDIQCVSLRYFNPIGAHPSGLIGELPIGVPTNLLPFITQTAIGKRPVLNVYGNDYNTPDGTAIRDYIHVVDLAKAHLKAIERIIERKCSDKTEFFNIGTGQGYSVLDVVHSFERVTGLRLNYRIASRRAGDVEQVWADTSRANKELGWKTERSLDEMTLSAWNWELNLAKKIKKLGE